MMGQQIHILDRSCLGISIRESFPGGPRDRYSSAVEIRRRWRCGALGSTLSLRPAVGETTLLVGELQRLSLAQISVAVAVGGS